MSHGVRYSCRHCDMVQEYRHERERQIEARGGWRNEQASEGCIVFGTWLKIYEWPALTDEQT